MNKSIVIPGILCAGFASASGYLWQEMRAQRARADSLQDQIAELRSLQGTQPATTYAPPAAEAELAVAASPATESPPIVAQTPSIQLAPGTNEIPRNRAFNAFDQQQRMLKDPEYRRLMLAQQRMSMSRMYPDLATALGLSREQTDRLFDLLAEQRMRAMEARPSMRDMNGMPDEATLQEMQRQAREEQQSREMEVATLLGDAKLSEWKEYQQSMGARFQVNQLRDTLAGSDSALRQDQIQPLVAAIVQEQRRAPIDSGYNTLRPMQAMTAQNRMRAVEETIEHISESNQRIHDAATAILSSDQLTGLDEMLNQNLNMQRMHARMMRSRAEAEARGEVPPDASMGVVSSEVVAVGR